LAAAAWAACGWPSASTAPSNGACAAGVALAHRPVLDSKELAALHVLLPLREFRCAEGDAAGGLAELVAAEAALGAQVSINAPELARLQAVIGLCAPLASKREQAEEFASRARRAFAAQPRVSPYYLLPLKRLEQQLRTKSI
jgi:hypothetical protein